MFTKVIADRYANALLKTFAESKAIEKARRELQALADAYTSSEEFRRFLLNPKMPIALKKKILISALKEKLSEEVLNLLLLLIQKKRQNVLPELAQRYAELCDQIKGVEYVEVIAAVPVSPSLQPRLREAIQKFSLRQVDIHYKIEPEIVGGLIVKLGDKVIDASLKRRFDEMKRNLLAARLPQRLNRNTFPGEAA